MDSPFIKTFAAALQDVLDGFGPPNVFIYGQTGVGKTATTHKVTEYLEADAIEAGVNLTVFSINCNKRDTTYKVITHLANELYSEKTFKQGHHPDTLWDRIYTALDELGGVFLLSSTRSTSSAKMRSSSMNSLERMRWANLSTQR